MNVPRLMVIQNGPSKVALPDVEHADGEPQLSVVAPALPKVTQASDTGECRVDLFAPSASAAAFLN
jgi:hypothetical protein